MTDEKIERFPGVAKFFFEAPLYVSSLLDGVTAKNLFADEPKFDGYCPYCSRMSTFSRSEGEMSLNQVSHFPGNPNFAFREVAIRCARSEHHVILFALRCSSWAIQKVGQYPSFADIALDESKMYAAELGKEERAELHKAIGLAAHGVGIGAYVYIRRIFETLIHKRFLEFKEVEGWSDEAFDKLRMAEKIEFLKDHLPAILVENRKIYAILSLGIHELKEEDCLRFFEVIRTMTTIVLTEDRKKKEELAVRKKLARAIADFEDPKKKVKEEPSSAVREEETKKAP